MRRSARTTAAAAALLAGLLPAAPGLAAGSTPAATGVADTATTRTVDTGTAPDAGGGLRPADLPRLREQVREATAQVERLSADLLAEAARTATLRVAMDRVAEEQDAARAALGRRLREAYKAAPDPMHALRSALAPGAARLLAAGAAAGVTVDRHLVDAVESESAEVAALRQQSETMRAELSVRADAVYAAHDRARELLAAAEAAWAEQQRRAADARARAEAAAAQRELATQRATLQQQAASVAVTVAPAVTARGRKAAAAQEPVIALLEETQRTAPGALPPGFRTTGQVLVGDSSWYGPGFVGKPTASGSPYDPERLTAAMKAVPLGTVVRVSRPDGRAVTVLVTDRGPYAGDRILDLSQAAMRELGRFGVGEVRIEVLARA